MSVAKKLINTIGTMVVSRREGLSTIMMGLAAVVTAWCAFESTRWGGKQAIAFSKAAASRTESSRNDLISNQLTQIDVATFLAWIQAVGMERGSVEDRGEVYQPQPNTLSGFLYGRFRPEFKPAVDAWVRTRPLRNPDAPHSPFAMPEYRRPLQQRAEELLTEAKEYASAAHQANRHADNYMLVTVISAMVIFFAGLSGKLQMPANGAAMLIAACIAFLACAAILLSLPVTIVD